MMPDVPKQEAVESLAPLSLSFVAAGLLIGVLAFVFKGMAILFVGLIVLRLASEINFAALPLMTCGAVVMSLIAAAIQAIVIALRWCHNARKRAALSPKYMVGDRRVFRFTLRSFLVFQFCVAACLGVIQWLGAIAAPYVGGLGGAAIGYWLTLFLARRRAYDVFVSSLVGIAVAFVIAAVADEHVTYLFSISTFMAIVVLPGLAASIARRGLQKEERCE